jgi:hypothetical protein
VILVVVCNENTGYVIPVNPDTGKAVCWLGTRVNPYDMLPEANKKAGAGSVKAVSTPDHREFQVVSEKGITSYVCQSLFDKLTRIDGRT